MSAVWNAPSFREVPPPNALIFINRFPNALIFVRRV
jgi:hypothetical protein